MALHLGLEIYNSFIPKALLPFWSPIIYVIYRFHKLYIFPWDCVCNPFEVKLSQARIFTEKTKRKFFDLMTVVCHNDHNRFRMNYMFSLQLRSTQLVLVYEAVGCITE